MVHSREFCVRTKGTKHDSLFWRLWSHLELLRGICLIGFMTTTNIGQRKGFIQICDLGKRQSNQQLADATSTSKGIICFQKANSGLWTIKPGFYSCKLNYLPWLIYAVLILSGLVLGQLSTDCVHFRANAIISLAPRLWVQCRNPLLRDWSLADLVCLG